MLCQLAQPQKTNFGMSLSELYLLWLQFDLKSPNILLTRDYTGESLTSSPLNEAVARQSCESMMGLCIAADFVLLQCDASHGRF